MIGRELKITLNADISYKPLPKRLMLYAIEPYHIVLTVTPSDELRRICWFRGAVRAELRGGVYEIEVPDKVSEICPVGRSGFTALSSEEDPGRIDIYFDEG